MGASTAHGDQSESVENGDACPVSVPVLKVGAGQTGALRELMVAADLMRRGYQVFRNMGPHGIDLVALIDGAFLPIEVTSGYRRADGSVPCPHKGKHYRFDIIVAVLGDGEIRYFDARPVDVQKERPISWT